MNLYKAIPLALAAVAVNALAASPVPMPREVESARANIKANQDRLPIILGHTPLADLADNAGRGEYGTKLRRTLVQAPAFHPSYYQTALNHVSAGYYAMPSGSTGDGYYRAPVELPDGASLCYIGIYAYDTSTTHMTAEVMTYSGGFQAITGNSTNITATASSTVYGSDVGNVVATTGIGEQFAANRIGGSGILGFPNCITINNDVLHGGNLYAINLVMDPVASAAYTQTFRAVDLAWYRQISPAPASASFTDVPTTDGFFQAIEAMKSSGITTGCGGTSFCPNSNVTRGQLAAFMARALGL